MNSLTYLFRSALVSLYKKGFKLLGRRGLQRIWPIGLIVEALMGFMSRLPRPESVEFLGHTFFLDSNDNLGLTFWGEKELDRGERVIAERFINKGDVVLDIGANIGFFTVLFARAVGQGGHVFAFEPAPENLAVLEKNVAVNGYTNVTVVPKAVSDRSGTVKLFLSNYNVGDHRIYDPYERTKSWEKNSAVYDRLRKKTDRRQLIEVPMISIDDFLKKHNRPVGYIKIDIQGAEGGVLKGMMNTLRRNRDVKLVSEFWPAGLKMFGIDAKEYLSLFESLGFSFYEIRNDGDPPFRPVTSSFLLQAYTVHNNRTVDLFIKRD